MNIWLLLSGPWSAGEFIVWVWTSLHPLLNNSVVKSLAQLLSNYCEHLRFIKKVTCLTWISIGCSAGAWGLGMAACSKQASLQRPVERGWRWWMLLRQDFPTGSPQLCVFTVQFLWHLLADSSVQPLRPTVVPSCLPVLPVWSPSTLVEPYPFPCFHQSNEDPIALLANFLSDLPKDSLIFNRIHIFSSSLVKHCLPCSYFPVCSDPGIRTSERAFLNWSGVSSVVFRLAEKVLGSSLLFPCII